MQFYYYINDKGAKDGPHDLVTIMRRVRAQKILPDTPVYPGESAEPVAAHHIDELRLFFNRPVEDMRNELHHSSISIGHALQLGWSFTTENNIVTVIAGGMLLFTILFAGLVGSIASSFATPTSSWVATGCVCWFVYFIMHNFFIASALRLFRGQTLNLEVIEKQLGAVALPMVLSSMILGGIVLLGLTFLIIPGIFALTLYAFVPLVIFDHGYDAVQAMSASRTLIQKLDALTILKLALLGTLYIAALPLLIPVPLLLPIFAGAICAIYEEVSAL